MHALRTRPPSAFLFSLARTRASLAVLAASAAWLLGGCASTQTGYERADDTAAVVQQTADSVQSVSEGLDQAIAGLRGLENPPARSSQQEQLETFQAGLARAEESWQATNEGMDALRQQSSAYFDKWENDIASLTDADVRSSSQERRAELMEAVAQFQSTYEDVRVDFPRYLESMRNVDQMLRNDFTPEGVRAAQDFIADLRSEATRQMDALETLLAEANRVARSFTVAN